MMTDSKFRSNQIRELAALIAVVKRPHPQRVAIDGVDAAGKTILADELVTPIREFGRPVIRASVDGFHNPRVIRYQLGPDSPEGYYRDSFNHKAILECLLRPLGPGGSLRYRPSSYDYRLDTPLREPFKTAPQDAVLLFDGVFLLRPELRSYWDYSVFVDVAFNSSVHRAIARDSTQTDKTISQKALRRKYEQRYIPGQRLYLESAQPKTYADIILDNNNLAYPILIRKSPCTYY
jgi:uridine kinase